MAMVGALRKVEVIALLEARILKGEFPAGTKLPSERELADEYGVSRPVIREGMAGLVERGLVAVHPGRGAFVRGVATDELAESLNRVAARSAITTRDVVQARLMVEVTAARLAAQSAPANLVRLRSALETHEAAKSLDEVVSTDLAIHEEIVAATGNPVIALMFGAIRSQVYALMLRSHSDRDVHSKGDPQHRAIVEAIASRDPDTAAAIMQEHLSLALDLFGSDVDRPINEVLESRGIAAAPLLVTALT
ncbi:DNA-binding FadR family transcriptional regulator [Microbacterium sp. SLBN-154]|uniref:FadR/GntR family transcriptional regulator n=1 Tax=Microbacterium sp. SLBN-154 TaxID=2768458 RepID=UPI00114E5648|nr:FadR/GntR family transcriptional regulator [Microbacterium sp. SLBN-154]TQK17650.1 DNA-binding FadR family transcriptional regulator [Microbacterium sp. SLBN-154]